MHEEDGAKNVDFILVVEGVGGAGFEGHVLADAGVVDDDVNLELVGFGVGKMVLSRGDDMCGAVGAAQVSLYGDSFDGVAFF